jgi:hypothetical protein
MDMKQRLRPAFLSSSAASTPARCLGVSYGQATMVVVLLRIRGGGAPGLDVPRMMTAVRPFEFVITPNVTYINFENNQPRRIYTDGRGFPTDEEATWPGYSIGKWLDTDNDGRFDTLEVETRNLKGPRVYEASGIPLHSDNESIIYERIALDKENKDVLRYAITTVDHALTKPWTVVKTFRRERNVLWYEDQCSENNNHVVVGKEFYFLSGDGYLMPTRKDQPPPDTRYFRTGR